MTAGPRTEVPAAPSVGGSVRAAIGDFYFNSWRLVPANGLWGIGLVALIGLAFNDLRIAMLLSVLLAVPTVGIFRMAALIVRGEPVAFRDALAAWRAFALPALAGGAVIALGTLILGFNFVVGLASLELMWWALATLAGWGLFFGWMIALPWWALLVDPVRAGEPLTARLRLAVGVVVVRPLRFVILFLLMTAILIVSTIMFAALLTISIAFIALVAARYTLPAADRLEGRQTRLIAE